MKARRTSDKKATLDEGDRGPQQLRGEGLLVLSRIIAKVHLSKIQAETNSHHERERGVSP